MQNSLEIQANLYRILSSLNYQVYDYTPIDPKMPFIKIGYMNSKEYSCKTADGLEFTQYIDVFSDYKGQKQVKEIMNQILEKINQFKKNNEELHVSLANTEVIEEKDKESTVGPPKGSIFHGVLIYKFKSI